MILIASLIIAQLAGIFGSFFTSSSVSTWYLTLQKPFFNPPSWVFAPVWICLFFLIGLSLYFVWISESKYKKVGLWFFSIQLVLNILWSMFFFGLKNPLLGLIDIVFLWAFILVTMLYFFKIDRRAGWFFVPYLVWVSFAVVLNYTIVLLN